ncbi:hypothetical protein ACFLUG_02585 [Chloroflexota bacterium]
MVSPLEIKEEISIPVNTGKEMLSEVLVICPGCKAFQTLQFNNGDMVRTRKYTQVGTFVYHDCATNLACYLYK